MVRARTIAVHGAPRADIDINLFIQALIIAGQDGVAADGRTNPEAGR